MASFLSNSASTTLTLTFSLPIIRSLDPEDPFIKAILFGLAWSGNSGGTSTPICSPQNILAVKYISTIPGESIPFLKWMGFGVPVGLVGLICCYVYLIIKFKPMAKEIDLTVTREYSKWSWKHTFTSVITILTIVLWAINDSFEDFFGHIGITSILPVVSFFGVGVLDGKDFGSLRWSTLVLMGGGLALGEAMNLSGLLQIISDAFMDVLSGLSFWVVCMILCVFVSIISSVVNHTSAAAILFQVFMSVGEHYGATYRIIVLSCLSIAFAQLFHISSFPNALVSGVQRHSRIDASRLSSESFLKGKDFFIQGWLVMLLGVLAVISVGYGILEGMGLQ